MARLVKFVAWIQHIEGIYREKEFVVCCADQGLKDGIVVCVSHCYCVSQRGISDVDASQKASWCFGELDVVGSCCCCFGVNISWIGRTSVVK